MLCNNFMNQWMRNLRKFLMNFTKSEMPVCPDVLINPVFQVLSDEGPVPGSLLIVNVCPPLIKHLTPLSHIWLIHYTFPIHCNKLTANFNWTDILYIQKPKTAHTSHSAEFSIFLLIFKYYKKFQNDRINMSLTWLVTKSLLRPVNLEMVQFVDLCKCYVQSLLFGLSLYFLTAVVCWTQLTQQ
jgi:hypothetical protein